MARSLGNSLRVFLIFLLLLSSGIVLAQLQTSPMPLLGMGGLLLLLSTAIFWWSRRYPI